MRRRGLDAKFLTRFPEFCVAVESTAGISSDLKRLTPPNFGIMANNNVIDLASEAASLPASTAPLPLFPSDSKLVEKDEYKKLRLSLLQLVERERAHLDASKYDVVLGILWGGWGQLSQPKVCPVGTQGAKKAD